MATPMVLFSATQVPKGNCPPNFKSTPHRSWCARPVTGRSASREWPRYLRIQSTLKLSSAASSVMTLDGPTMSAKCSRSLGVRDDEEAASVESRARRAKQRAAERESIGTTSDDRGGLRHGTGTVSSEA